MATFVKQFCFSNDDEHRRVLEHLKTLSKLTEASESQIAYKAIKIYVEKEIKFRQTDLQSCEQIEQVRRETQEKIATKQLVNPNAFCKECGASELDSEGYVIHGVDCSETQKLVEKWGSREAWKQWIRKQKAESEVKPVVKTPPRTPYYRS